MVLCQYYKLFLYWCWIFLLINIMLILILKSTLNFSKSFSLKSLFFVCSTVSLLTRSVSWWISYYANALKVVELQQSSKSEVVSFSHSKMIFFNRVGKASQLMIFSVAKLHYIAAVNFIDCRSFDYFDVYKHFKDIPLGTLMGL